MTHHPNADTIPPGYEIVGPPLARSGIFHRGGEPVLVAWGPGGLTRSEAAADCREHYRMPAPSGAGEDQGVSHG